MGIICTFGVMEIIKQNIDTLNKLCKQYHVAELYIFGSYAKNKVTDSSDIDLLVKFSGVEPIDYFDNYFEFKEALEKLFSRYVDLVEVQTIKNPILKKSIDRDKKMIYGRENSKMAV